MSRKVTKFEADDGTLHDSLAQCKLHEATELAKSKLATELGSALATGRPSSVLIALTASASEVVEILRSIMVAEANVRRGQKSHLNAAESHLNDAA
jgi:hypothetical protein